LGARWWRPDATGTIAGLTQGTTRAHIVRAALESLSHQIVDLAGAFAADGAPWRLLRIDGGMSANDWIAQDMADMIDLTVHRPADVETTARGAAMLAAVGSGLFATLHDAAKSMESDGACFTPTMNADVRAGRLAGWRQMVQPFSPDVQ
jgi:glycerol kinase